MFLRLFIVGVLFSSSLSLAKVHKRGWLECREGKLEYWEEINKYEPDDVNAATAYGQCLIAAGEEIRGRNIWEDIVLRRASYRERVKPAFLYAAYIETGGTFDVIEYKNLTAAIEVYDLVLSSINVANDKRGPNNIPYPWGGVGNDIYEEFHQIELTTCWKIPYLYIQRFHSGAIGHYRHLKFNSPSYTGDKTLETYYDYHINEMTLISLEKAIETAKDCLERTETFKDHFTRDAYRNAREISQIIKAAAEKLEPLEEQRLDAADKYSCWRDIFDCEEHQNIKSQMVEILNSMWANLKAL